MLLRAPPLHIDRPHDHCSINGSNLAHGNHQSAHHDTHPLPAIAPTTVPTTSTAAATTITTIRTTAAITTTLALTPPHIPQNRQRPQRLTATAIHQPQPQQRRPRHLPAQKPKPAPTTSSTPAPTTSPTPPPTPNTNVGSTSPTGVPVVCRIVSCFRHA